MILDHHDLTMKVQRQSLGTGRWNGAYYYSVELCRNIIPYVYTDRDWITMKVDNRAADHSIYFVHNNLNPDRYAFLANYSDVVLVCGIQETTEKVKGYGIPIYLPLSVDVGEVEQYARPKTKDTAFVGRMAKRRDTLPDGIDYIENIPREELLARVAEYRQVYAVGRCAIEAKVLGCEVLPYDPRFPDPSVWKIMDNRDAAKILQEELDKIDGRDKSEC